MSAQFVTHLDGRAVGDHPEYQSFFGEEPKFVRQGPAGNAGKHGLHLVEPAWTRDVQSSEDFDGPTRGKHVKGFHGRLNFPLRVVRSLVRMLGQQMADSLAFFEGGVSLLRSPRTTRQGWTWVVQAWVSTRPNRLDYLMSFPHLVPF